MIFAPKIYLSWFLEPPVFCAYWEREFIEWEGRTVETWKAISTFEWKLRPWLYLLWTGGSIVRQEGNLMICDSNKAALKLASGKTVRRARWKRTEWIRYRPMTPGPTIHPDYLSVGMLIIPYSLPLRCTRIIDDGNAMPNLYGHYSVLFAFCLRRFNRKKTSRERANGVNDS